MRDVVDYVLDLFDQKGSMHYGENVTQIEHAVQCASLAKRDSFGHDLVAAALLHDVGHLMHEMGDSAYQNHIDDLHEDLAANWLREHFPPAVTEPIRLHVAAKRYLCAVDPSYYDRLSQGSKNTLAMQGGPMNAAEVLRFESEPHYEAAVQLRRYDDEGKDAHLSSGSVRQFRGALEATVLKRVMA